MTSLEQKFKESYDRGQTLKHEFDARFSSLQAEGLIDVKMKLMNTDDGTTDGVVAVLNNVLRLRSEGKSRALRINV